MESAIDLETMERYKVNICPDWILNTCPLSDDACFHAHSTVILRRKPVLLYQRFNYLPKSCMFMQSKAVCPKGQNCRFAHNYLETCFHPSTYRTKLCTECTRERCLMAHTVEELRMPVFECYRTPMCDLNWLQNGDPSLHLHYMTNYKTKPCAGKCECDGFDYHSDSERRRMVVRYSPIPCPSACSDNNCPFAHSRMEVMYHPANYKTAACSRFTKTRRCLFGDDCAHAHGANDLRISSAIYE